MKEILTLDSISEVTGSWIIQLTENMKDVDITKSANPGFWLEKRISFVGRIYNCDGLPYVKFEDNKGEVIVLNGIYYCHGVFSEEEFVEYFNNYMEGHKGERFHRLLTKKELKWLHKQLKHKR
jgi:hypothetical protein